MQEAFLTPSSIHKLGGVNSLPCVLSPCSVLGRSCIVIDCPSFLPTMVTLRILPALGSPCHGFLHSMHQWVSSRGRLQHGLGHCLQLRVTWELSFPTGYCPQTGLRSLQSPRRCGALSARWPSPENSKVRVRPQESDCLDSFHHPLCPQCLTCRGATKAPDSRGSKNRVRKCGKPGVWHDYFESSCY